MAARAVWKGHLEIGELVCAVALHAAASTSERIAFHILNRKTGHRVEREYVDAETGKPVDREDQAKGYTTDKGKEVVLNADEVAAAVPEGDKRLRVEAFVACDEVDTLYLDRPYYLTPAEESAETAFAVIRDGLVKFRDEAQSSFFASQEVQDGATQMAEGMTQLDAGLQTAIDAERRLGDGAHKRGQGGRHTRCTHS